MKPNFQDKIAQAPSRIILHMNPIFELLPIPIWRYDDPFLPFAKAIIPATHDLVAGYLFNFPRYLAMAGAGAVALERSIALVPQDRVRILHAPFVGDTYSAMADATAFDVDALTVIHKEDYQYYSDNPPFTAFMMSHANNDDKDNTYNSDTQQLHYQANGQTKTFKLTTNDILYASKNDDFLDKLCEGIQSLI
ncbi:MAG: hypothetical protein WBC91_04195 [Phototrophicaceae bacterium]